jgi:hypothetical protein
MTAVYDTDGTRLRRERTGELVPDADAASPSGGTDVPPQDGRPCTPAEIAAHAARIRAMIRDTTSNPTHAERHPNLLDVLLGTKEGTDHEHDPQPT